MASLRFGILMGAMDPLAHTLVGATLAETRLGRMGRTTLAAPALILGANAPDIDAVTMFLGRDVSLGFRRGWTHGALAMLVLPLALTGLLLLLDRAVAAWRGREPRARAGPLLALSTVGVLSHPALDWLNTYGVRLLMPFDGTWFYGDALFIVDPWVWLLAATPVVLANSASRLGAAAWIVLGIAATSLVTGFAGAPAPARLLWCVGVAAIAWLRLTGRWTRHVPRVAAACAVVLAVYAVLMAAASAVAERQVAALLGARALPGTPAPSGPIEVMASPAPGNPLRRDIVVADAAHYHFLELDWLADPPLRAVGGSIPRGARDPVVEAALTAPHVWGLSTWMRFPAFHVEETGDGYRVSISDVRYARRPGGGFGATVVDLDRELRVRRPGFRTGEAGAGATLRSHWESARTRFAPGRGSAAQTPGATLRSHWESARTRFAPGRRSAAQTPGATLRSPWQSARTRIAPGRGSAAQTPSQAARVTGGD